MHTVPESKGLVTPLMVESKSSSLYSVASVSVSGDSGGRYADIPYCMEGDRKEKRKDYYSMYMCIYYCR